MPYRRGRKGLCVSFRSDRREPLFQRTHCPISAAGHRKKFEKNVKDIISSATISKSLLEIRMWPRKFVA